MHNRERKGVVQVVERKRRKKKPWKETDNTCVRKRKKEGIKVCGGRTKPPGPRCAVTPWAVQQVLPSPYPALCC